MKEQKRIFEIIKTQIGNYQLVDAIGEVLGISDDAVYRRVRGDTALTLPELQKICQAFCIPLDNILGSNALYRSFPYYFHNQDYFNLNETDYRMSSDYIEAIREASKNSSSEFGFVSNTMPLHTRVKYPPVFRYFVMKWMYQTGGIEKAVGFSKVVISDRLQELHRQYTKMIQNINYTYVICHEFSISHIIHDVRFFRDIHLVTNDDLAEIKESLYTFLDDISKIITDGAYPTGNRLDFYLSGLSVETSYSYLASGETIISMIDAFTTGAVTSLNFGAGELMRRCMQSLKRTSTLISGSEKNRIMFIEKQKEMLNAL